MKKLRRAVTKKDPTLENHSLLRNVLLLNGEIGDIRSPNSNY
jgi:hypothetical protein